MITQILAAAQTPEVPERLLPEWAPEWAETALTVFLIIAIAILIQRIVRRLIKRTVRGLQGDRAQRGLSHLRSRTPKALLNTGENVTLRRAQRAETIGTLLRSAATLLIFVFAAFAIARQFDLGTGFIAGAGIATAALGFGAQNVVRDFLAGIFIVVEDQYGVGDVVNVDIASGVVESVSLRTTKIRDISGTLWHIPNGEIQAAGNLSQEWSRAVVDLRLALDTDISTAVRIMKREADELWNDTAYAGIIIQEPEIWGPESVAEDGINIKIMVKTRPLEQWQVARTLLSRTKRALDAAGIQVQDRWPLGAMGDDMSQVAGKDKA